MAGGASLINTGLSGLTVAQRALSTAGHNIANVNSDGYTRQRVDLAARNPQRVGPGFIGAGVHVTQVRRVYDQFLTTQLRNGTATGAHTDKFLHLASQLDNLLADPAGGLSPVVQGFFDSVQALSNDPASISSRQVMLSEARTLVQRFHTLDRRLEEHETATGQQLKDLVIEINGFAKGIAALNGQILDIESGTPGQANDLRDRRDTMLRQLAKRINVDAFPQADGSLNVTVGSGQALVVGRGAGTLSVVGSVFDPAREEIAFGTVTGGTGGVITNLISGGAMAGVLDFRTKVLDGSRNAIGRIAIGIAAAINAQHRLGMDLDGLAGGVFFNDLPSISAQVNGNAANTGSPPGVLKITVRDAGSLTDSDYRLDRVGATYTLTRVSDGTVTTLAGFPTTPATVDGLDIALTAGAIAAGDSFLIQPTRLAGTRFALAITSTRSIAAAAPVRGARSLANTGTGILSAVRVNSPNDRLQISFDSPPTTFDVLDTTTGAALASNVAYTSGGSISFNGLTFAISGTPAAGDTFSLDHTVGAVGSGNSGSGTIGAAAVAAFDANLTAPVTITFNTPASTFSVSGAVTGTPTVNVPYTTGSPISFNGWTVNITGVPSAGDSFTISPNTAGVGDNRNALAMAGLQSANTLINRGASFQDAYSQLVTDIGTLTRGAEIDADAQGAMLAQLQASRDEVSGVNLDEEAADLLRFQQAYQASARMIAVANDLFRTLMSAVGG